MLDSLLKRQQHMVDSPDVQPNWLTQRSSTLAGGAAALAEYMLFFPCLLDLQTSNLEGQLCLWKGAHQAFKI
jgi:hypothetical protein